MKRYIFLLAIFSFLLSNCYKNYELTDIRFDNYKRVVGPKGGEITFFANYENDKSNEVLLHLDVPQGALDSMMVFNMYQFEDYELVVQMQDGYAEIGSKFIYFVPFYESDGYNERGQLDLSYHLSVDFNQPLTVTYNFLAGDVGLSAQEWQKSELYHDHYKKSNKTYRLYRIKIPKLDEWGEGNNIYVNWNGQGYPEGYDRTDLYYIISGKWSAVSAWGEGALSLENWEEVPEFELNVTDDYVRFNIPNTDYIYVISRIVYLDESKLPIKITKKVTELYPNLSIDRASFDGKDFQVFLDDGTYLSFAKSGGYMYRVIDEFKYWEDDIGIGLQNLIVDENPGVRIKKAILTEWENNRKEYEFVLSNGIKLLYDDNGVLIGRYEYGVDMDNVPDVVKSYMSQNFPGELITNVTYDDLDSDFPLYIVYTSTNKKVYFNDDGTWLETFIYKIEEQQLPQGIQDYFVENYPNTGFSQITHTDTIGSTYYEISLVDDRWFRFDNSAALSDVEFQNLSEDDLPEAISDFQTTHFPNSQMTEIWYYWENYGDEEVYDVYFDDRLNIEFDPDGSIKALYGNNPDHLPATWKTMLGTDYPGEKLVYCVLDISQIETEVPNGDVVSYYWEWAFESGRWIGFDQNKTAVFEAQLEAPIIITNTLVADAFARSNYGSIAIDEMYHYFSETQLQEVYCLLLADGRYLNYGADGTLLGSGFPVKKGSIKPIVEKTKAKHTIFKKLK